ncbi:ER membrane protein complex subunit 10 [Plodia interpunctella]|uniref:ER membrane protein complex subunit 10 n=1 Tax=Plodia interpunctella TaxID=58824 RepID=UPI00236789D3|nr:ER membrane protein complex subunit 10 [Plodia interpunctella]
MKTILKLIYFIKIFQYAICIDYDGWLNIKIEHTINCNEKYCTRGNIGLKSIRSGISSIEQTPFTKQHIQELKEIAEYDGFYSIRTIVTSAENRETEFLSSVKARAFLESGLSDVINAWVLPNGAVIVVSFQVANSSRPLKYESDKGYSINSNFYLRHVDQAPVPDTASYIQKLEREREAREKGDVKDNRSFLAKYWMYIVPIAIFVMISGATNPEPAAQSAR